MAFICQVFSLCIFSLAFFHFLIFRCAHPGQNALLFKLLLIIYFAISNPTMNLVPSGNSYP